MSRCRASLLMDSSASIKRRALRSWVLMEVLNDSPVPLPASIRCAAESLMHLESISVLCTYPLTVDAVGGDPAQCVGRPVMDQCHLDDGASKLHVAAESRLSKPAVSRRVARRTG